MRSHSCRAFPVSCLNDPCSLARTPRDCSIPPRSPQPAQPPLSTGVVNKLRRPDALTQTSTVELSLTVLAIFPRTPGLGSHLASATYRRGEILSGGCTALTGPSTPKKRLPVAWGEPAAGPSKTIFGH